MKDYKYLFGPVPSRRFGRSLGVDLNPYKTCSLDCVFCQLGRTTERTVTRQEYVPTDMVLAELKDWIKTDGRADYITLSGSGEPTLHSGFGEILEFISSESTIPAALLTNGTMLNLQEVRDAASLANVVKVSFSAWDQASYGWVNRPHPQLLFDNLVEGQKAFRAQFKGQLWMEVFLMAGINSMPVDVSKIANLAKEIAPDRIQLNTAVRPPAEDFATALSKERMEVLIYLFHPTAEVIAEFKAKHANHIQANQETIFSMLQRRPCTADQIADIFGMHLNEVSKYLGNLMRTDQICAERKNTTVYYAAKNIKS
ncbi:MAG: radical SAM protein [Deltaproteobacteria bacterium]|nr:radical SAM protein [Deltaproteobacteria bacterium]MBW2661387.1 radical SAM protein [Deltaproteobacteria bacterium]